MTDRPLCILEHGQDGDGNPRHAEAVTGLLCRRHRDQIDNHTTEIVNLILDVYAITAQGLTGPPREDVEKTRHVKAAEAPAPGDLGIMALFDGRTHTQRLPGDQSEPMVPIAAMIASWTLLVGEERPLTELPNSIVAQLDLLALHGDWMAAQPWIDDLLTELAEIRQHLRAAVREPAARPVGRCPSQDGNGVVCDGPLWADRNGDMAVDCGRCGRHYDERFLRHLGGMMAS